MYDLTDSENKAVGRNRNQSISEAFAQSYHNSMGNSPFEFGGRSYISHRLSIAATFNSPKINGTEIHVQSAGLASVGVTDDFEDEYSEEGISPEDPISQSNVHSISSPRPISSNQTSPDHEVQDLSPLLEESYSSQKRFYTDLESNPQASKHTKNDIRRKPSFLHTIFVQPIQYIPAVFLGTLLNILDGLSYGMIMFPISEAIFAQLAPAGLSMFYMSCIVSQMIYSCGGSAFKAGIGSEMIEVTPFFHNMAWAIVAEMKGTATNEAIIATTITSYAASSLVTGLVFLLLGKYKLGALVGFFPRHILEIGRAHV